VISTLNSVAHAGPVSHFTAQGSKEVCPYPSVARALPRGRGCLEGSRFHPRPWFRTARSTSTSPRSSSANYGRRRTGGCLTSKNDQCHSSQRFFGKKILCFLSPCLQLQFEFLYFLVCLSLDNVIYDSTPATLKKKARVRCLLGTSWVPPARTSSSTPRP
jgi:hypothetical protein